MRFIRITVMLKLMPLLILFFFFLKGNQYKWRMVTNKKKNLSEGHYRKQWNVTKVIVSMVPSNFLCISEHLDYQLIAGWVSVLHLMNSTELEEWPNIDNVSHTNIKWSMSEYQVCQIRTFWHILNRIPLQGLQKSVRALVVSASNFTAHCFDSWSSEWQ